MIQTDRGTSTPLGYALTLGITTLLVTGLLIAAGGFVGDQRERSIRGEMQVLGQQMASDIAAGDRFVQSSSSDFAISRSVPNRVVGTSYTIQVKKDGSGQPYLQLTSLEPEVTVTVDLALQTSIKTTMFSGGRIIVEYDDDPSVESLEVDNSEDH